MVHSMIGRPPRALGLAVVAPLIVTITCCADGVTIVGGELGLATSPPCVTSLTCCATETAART